VLNHTTSAADVQRVMDFLEHADPTIARPARSTAAPPAAGQPRAPLRRSITAGDSCDVAIDAIAGLAPFAQLSADELERIASLARIEHRPGGETVVEQWDASLDFHVIVDGRVEVIADDAVVAELRAGEFFGELVALDWGAGYGYARIAAVRTLDATTLLTFPAGSMNELARRHPEIAREMRRVGLRRLERDAR
jgi:CRP-like cAMP-binding protein